jgi:hypothetical protein
MPCEQGREMGLGVGAMVTELIDSVTGGNGEAVYGDRRLSEDLNNREGRRSDDVGHRDRWRREDLVYADRKRSARRSDDHYKVTDYVNDDDDDGDDDDDDDDDDNDEVETIFLCCPLIRSYRLLIRPCRHFVY